MSTPFTQLVPGQQKTDAVTDLFKNKNAIHTYNAQFYSRPIVYKKMGFKTFKSTDSTGKQRLKYQKTIQKSDLIGDDQAYQDALWQINDQKSGQFISLVTMQNHLPYTNKYDKYDYRVSGQAAGKNKIQIEHYAEGIHLTDISTKKFLNKIDEIKKPITVVWYGDHLAGLYDGDNMANYNVPLHETDYFVYSNKYARTHMQAKTKVNDNSKVIGPNSFTALALKQMNQKVTPYYALMTSVLNKLPAMALNSQDQSQALIVNNKNKQIELKQLTEKQRQIYNDYALVQYDLTAGKHYLSSNFMKKIK